ncbi:MAG: hypothetical protein ABIL62_08300 [Planctomycetota bacterium]
MFQRVATVICHLSSIVCQLPSALYICRESSTNQLLFMQNKPNFAKAQMNIKPYNTMDYENISDWTLGQNKPNSNPIKPNFKCKAPLHKQCDLLYLKGSFVMGHLGRYWQTKPNVSDKLT